MRSWLAAKSSTARQQDRNGRGSVDIAAWPEVGTKLSFDRSNVCRSGGLSMKIDTRSLSQLTATIFLVTAISGYAAPPADTNLVIKTISTDAARVTGGDVLIRIDVPSNVSPGDVRVVVNGVSVT